MWESRDRSDQADKLAQSLPVLLEHCRRQREASLDRWHPPGAMQLRGNGALAASLGSDGDFALNDWSFSQLCALARVSKDTLNRLSAETASLSAELVAGVEEIRIDVLRATTD